MEVKGGGVLVYVADGNCQGRVTSSEFFFGGEPENQLKLFGVYVHLGHSRVPLMDSCRYIFSSPFFGLGNNL